MAKRTQAQIKAAMEELQTELDGADTDDEVWIKDGDREIKVTGKRATTILGRFSDLFDTPDKGGEDEGEDEGEEEPPASGGYFKGRKK